MECIYLCFSWERWRVTCCKYFKISYTSFPTQKHTLMFNKLWSTIYFVPKCFFYCPMNSGMIAFAMCNSGFTGLNKNIGAGIAPKGLYSCFPAIKMGFHAFILQHDEFFQNEVNITRNSNSQENCFGSSVVTVVECRAEAVCLWRELFFDFCDCISAQAVPFFPLNLFISVLCATNRNHVSSTC